MKVVIVLIDLPEIEFNKVLARGLVRTKKHLQRLDVCSQNVNVNRGIHGDGTRQAAKRSEGAV